MGGTGDCGWRSLAASIGWNHDEVLDESLASTRGALLKTQAISYIRKDDFIPFFKKDIDTPPGEKPDDANKRFDDFLTEAALPQTWICDATLLAAAKKQGIPIIIWYRTKETEAWTRCCLAPAWKDGKPKCASDQKPVTLIAENQHYNWLAKPKSQNIPDAWLRESSIPDSKALRGAAKTIGSVSSETPSVHTLHSLGSKKSSSPSLGKQSCPTLHTMDIDLDLEPCALDEPAEVTFSDPTFLRPVVNLHSRTPDLADRTGCPPSPGRVQFVRPPSNFPWKTSE